MLPASFYAVLEYGIFQASGYYSVTESELNCEWLTVDLF